MSARIEAIGGAWYRQPLVWMIIAIPASSVVVGMVLLWLAIASNDGLVADDYYKRGLEINRVIDRYRVAQGAGLVGELDLAADGTRLTLTTQDPGFVLPASISLDLSYATRAGKDQRLELARTASGEYAAPASSLLAGRYYVYAGSTQWRISGVLDVPGSTRVLLEAQLAR